MKYVVTSFDIKKRTIDADYIACKCDTKQEALDQVRYWADLGCCPCIMTQAEFELYKNRVFDNEDKR